MSRRLPPDIELPSEVIRILNEAFKGIDSDIAQGQTQTPATATSGAGGVSVGTHSGRPSPSTGRIYIETDRSVAYYGSAGKWLYLCGTMRGTLSPDQKPAGLGTDDTGFQFFSTDFGHLYRWNGSAWRYAVELGDPGSGFIQMWTVPPNNNGVWQLCDGSTVTRSLNAGGTGSVTVPALTVGVYPKFGAAYTGTVSPAGPTQAVQSGVDASVAGATYGPANVVLLPYYRL